MSWLDRLLFLKPLCWLRRTFAKRSARRRSEPQRLPALRCEQCEDRNSPNNFFDLLGNTPLNALVYVRSFLGSIPAHVGTFNPAPAITLANDVPHKNSKPDQPGIWVGPQRDELPPLQKAGNGTINGESFASIRVAGGFDDVVFSTATDPLFMPWTGFGATVGIAGPQPMDETVGPASSAIIGAVIEPVAFKSNVSGTDSGWDAVAASTTYPAGGRFAARTNAAPSAVTVKYAAGATPPPDVSGTGSAKVTLVHESDKRVSASGAVIVDLFTPATNSTSAPDGFVALSGSGGSGGSGGVFPPNYVPPNEQCPVPNDQVNSSINVQSRTLPLSSTRPVRYADGTKQLSFRDLASDGFGSPWGQTRSWTNTPGYAQTNTYGDGVVVSEHLSLVQVDSDTIVQISNGSTARYFDLVGGTWTPHFYQQEKLEQNTAAGEFILTDTTGNQIRFYDFNFALPALQRGSLKSFVDQGGIVTTVTAHDAAGRITEIQRSQPSGLLGLGALTESYLYTYTAGGQLESVTLRRQNNPLPGGLGVPGVVPVWSTVRKVEYTYYGFGDANGTINDLKTAIIKDGAGNTLDTRYYRYYTSSSSIGYAGGLKFAFEPQSFARLAAVADPFTASDTFIKDFADYFFEYDSSQRITKEVVQGEGCSACTGGLGSFTYSYSTSTNPDGYNSWKTKTIETLPDLNTNTVYTNVYGQVMLKVFEDVASGDKWRMFSKYDTTDGRVLFTAMPSAVSGHDETKADLMDLVSGNYVHVRDSDGLISTTSYYTSTTATATTVGGATGYIQEMALKQGELGTLMPQSTREYIARVGPTATIFPVATSTQYRNDNGTGAQTITNDYTWFGATTLAQSVTTTLPAVTLAQNGSGTANAATVVNDIFGRPIWMKDEAGFLTHIAYDAATSAPIKVIRDVDTTRTSDFTALPAGWATPSGGGLHLTTAYEVDHLGRTTKTTHPNGNVDYMTYNDAAHEMRMYQGWDTATNRPTGPTVVMREDRPGSYTEMLTMSAMPSIGAGRPTGTESISGLQSLSRSYTNKAGQVTETDEYFNLAGLTYSTSTTLGTEGTHFYRTRIAYDNHGEVNRVQSPQGTIYRTVYDGLERTISEWVGTDDTPTTGFWSPTNLAGTDMVKVAENEYDGGGVGDSNLTKMTAIPGGGAANRVTQSFFDWRNRAVAMKSGVEASEAASVNRPLVYMNYDNLNQVTQTRMFDADGVTPTVTSGVPQPLAASLLRAKMTNSFDELGRVFRTDTFSVNSSSGAEAANTLHTDMWFDSRGNVVKTLMPGGLVQKAAYDGIGRVTVASVTDGGSDLNYTDAHNVTSDIVLEQNEPTYDANSNVLFTTTRQRFHDATGTGALGTPSSGIGARVSNTAAYFDNADRLTAVADAGTNAGSTWTRPTLVPLRSDTVHVTSYIYDDAGRVKDVIDPAGRVHRSEYDALGRTTKTIENFVLAVDGVVSVGDNKTTTFGYNAAGMTSLTAHLNSGGVLPSSGVQTTEWVYGVTTGTGGSTIASNDIVGKTRFPDATTGAASTSEQETVTVNALGETTTMTDRNGSVHTLTRDVLGRVVSDAVTTLGAGVDGAVRRIETAYDGQGNASLITSFDAASGGSIVNQVQREFNGLGQMTKERQEHGGAVTGSSPSVQYAYSEMTGGANHSRLTKITYPSGYELNYNYSSGLNDAISRLSSLSDSTGTLESYDHLGYGTVVRRAHPQPNVDLTYIKQAGEQNGDAGDQYTGLDRFYRVVDQRWIGSGITLDRYQYGYDRMGNRLFRDNLVNAAFGEIYTYDGLNQLATFARGTLNPLKNGLIGASSQSQDWNYDALGNWDSVTTSGSPQTRTHNQQNEITSVSGATNPTFDANGNMTTDETGKQFVYDAWNRLVKVKDSGGTTLKTYAYDGLYRRVSETVGTTTTDLIYSDKWQVLEEKVGSNTTKRYVWSPVYVDALIFRDRDTDNNGSLDERLWVLQDANFNVTALVDGSGTVVERYAYTPFGVVTVMDAAYTVLGGSAYDSNVLWQGMFFDPISGSYKSRFRTDISPTLGRPFQPDPIRFAVDVNFYRWEGNGPVNWLDPSGLDQDKEGNGTGSKVIPGIMTLGGDPITTNAADYLIFFADTKVGILNIDDSDRRLSKAERDKINGAVHRALEQITNANHLIQTAWDCIMKVAKKHPGGFTSIDDLRANRDYYQQQFQLAADRILNSPLKLTIEVVYEPGFFRPAETPAWVHEWFRFSDTVYITKHFISALNEKSNDTATFFLSHEFGRLFGDQFAKDLSGKLGDVYLWRNIVLDISTYRSEIEKCLCGQ